MMILESIYLWVYSLLYLLIHHFFPNKFPRKAKWAVRNLNAGKEFSWLELKRKKVPIVNAVIGPYMGWPEIQQVFRFIKQYSIPTILTIDGRDSNWSNETGEFIKAFKDWIINLLNRFEIPNEVFLFQMLDQEGPSKKISYMFFLENCMTIDQNAIHLTNRNKMIPSAIGNRMDNGKALDLILMKKLNNYFFNFHLEAIPSKKFDKLKWVFQLFKRIKYLFDLKEIAPSKKFFLIDLTKNKEIDKLLSCLIAHKVFEKNLGAVVFNDK